jgi:hypothetical protein
MRVLALLPAALILAAQTDTSQPARPDFSGRWRMVKDKSDFAGANMPDMIVRVVDQRNNTMNVHTVQTRGTKTTTADITYLLDGNESTNVINGHDAISKTFWDGSALMVRTSITLPNRDQEVITDRWELADNNQTLITSSHIVTNKGGVQMTLVCSKETVGK